MVAATGSKIQEFKYKFHISKRFSPISNASDRVAITTYKIHISLGKIPMSSPKAPADSS